MKKLLGCCSTIIIIILVLGAIGMFFDGDDTEENINESPVVNTEAKKTTDDKDAEPLPVGDNDTSEKESSNSSNEEQNKVVEAEGEKGTVQSENTDTDSAAANGSEALNSDEEVNSQKGITEAPSEVPDFQPSEDFEPEASETRAAANVSNNDYSPSVTVPEKEESEGNLVWVPTKGGTKYHSKSSCSGMDDPMQVSLETALANGYTACRRCH